VAYCLGNHELGRFLSAEKIYYQEGEATREEFVFGQVIHGGDWDPHPSGNMTLLKHVAAKTTLEVQFKRANVDLRKAEAFQYPVLYMTGHDDFVLTDEEVAGHDDFVLTDEEVASLRSYLRNGGILLADSCCGRKAFDNAFRREIARVLPKHELKPLEPTHPLFSIQSKIGKVTYSGILRQNHPEMQTPQMLGIVRGGSVVQHPVEDREGHVQRDPASEPP